MVRKNLTIKNKSGLHARPASDFVMKASSFKSDITIYFNDKKINAKSIIALLAGGLKAGSNIELEVNGVDEINALNELTKLIESKFGE